MDKKDTYLKYSAKNIKESVDIVLNNCYFKCTKCGEVKGANYFGLRNTGQVRNQSQCIACRNKK